MRGDKSFDDMIGMIREYHAWPSAQSLLKADAATTSYVLRVVKRWFMEQESRFHGQSPRLKKDPRKPAEGQLLSVVRAPKVLRYVEFVEEAPE